MRYYVTSDTHGFYDELISQLKSAGYFDDTAPRKLIILGDLMDRGNQAKELQEQDRSTRHSTVRLEPSAACTGISSACRS